MAVLGLALMLVTLGAGGTIALVRARGFGINPYKPAWVLEREAVRAVQADEGVLAELMVRRAAGKLGAEVHRRLVLHALARQADAALGWSPLWGDMIEDASVAGELTPEQCSAFLLNGVGAQLEVRDRVPVGESLFYHLTLTAARQGTRPRLDVAVKGETLEIAADDGSIITRRVPGGPGIRGGSKRAEMSSNLTTTGIPPGERKTTLRLRCAIAGAPGGAAVFKEVAVTQPITFLAPGQSSVRMVRDDALRDSIREALHVFRLRRNGAAPPNYDMDLEIGFKTLPVNLSLRIQAIETLEDGTTKDWDFRGVCFRKGQPGVHLHSTNLPTPPGFTATKVMIVLTADPPCAAATADVQEVWDGEITLPEVEIEPMRALGTPGPLTKRAKPVTR